MTPLRQFKGVPADVVRKAEGKQFVSHLSYLLFVFLINPFHSLGIATLI